MTRKVFKTLKAYRQLKGINQQVLSDLIGVAPNTYSFKENGKQQFTLGEAKQIADYFGKTVDDIFFSITVN